MLLQLLLQRTSNLPPSPLSLPVLGHFHLFVGRVPHYALHELSKKYGPIVLLWLGFRRTLVIASADIAKEVFKTHDSIFYSKPYTIVGEYVVYKYKDIAFTQAGEHWKELRKLLVQFFSVKRADLLLSFRKKEVSSIIKRVLKLSEPVKVRTFLSDFSFNIMTFILMGRTFVGPDGEVTDSKGHRFREILDELLGFAISFNLSEYLPVGLRWLDWNIYRAKKLHLKQDRFLQELLDERINSKNESDDLLSFLLSNLRRRNDQHIIMKALLMELSSGGSDSSSTVLEWALAELMNHPESLKKAQEEIAFAVGNERMVNDDDIPKLDYLWSIITETLRLHPPVKVLTRMSTAATTIAGYHIPAGTLTYINLHSTGRDPATWKDPLEFRPERFQQENRDVDFRGQHFQLTPFGSGRRLCLGIPLALKIVPLLLANLIHGFDWSFPPGRENHSMEDVFGGVAPMEEPLEAVAVPRLPLDAYNIY